MPKRRDDRSSERKKQFRPGAKEVRLCGGAFNGRRLKGGPGIRPTPSMVREAMFSMLADWIGGAKVLDLFAGTGAVSFEALGRGARFATLIDVRHSSIEAVRANIATLGLRERTETIEGNALGLLASGRFDGGGYDLAFIGPPFDQDFCLRALERLRPEMLSGPGAIALVQASRFETLPDAVGFLERRRIRDYGDSILHFYHPRQDAWSAARAPQGGLSMDPNQKRYHQTSIDADGGRTLNNWMMRRRATPGRKILPEPGDGLRLWNKAKAAPGYVLFSPDHSLKFLLIDLAGEIVHEWPAWTSHFGYLLDNGHLLLDTEFSPNRTMGIYELDWEGNEVWFHPCEVHHDFQRLPNGNTMILCHRETIAPEIGAGTLLSSYLNEVTPDHKVVWEWHAEEHIEELKRLTGQTFPLSDPDWTHSNTVCVLGDTPAARDRRFKPGNVMVSHRNLDTAIVIERETGEIVWAWGPGTLSRQHATILLPNGHMLCFDNGTARKWSAVWELEPIERAIVWSYKGTPPESFFASALSNAQRLPNGNTFICSGSKPDHGRLFEVTPEGEIVWEYQNHYAAYAQGEKIVYRAYKYPPETIEPFLNK